MSSAISLGILPMIGLAAGVIEIATMRLALHETPDHPAQGSAPAQVAKSWSEELLNKKTGSQGSEGQRKSTRRTLYKIWHRPIIARIAGEVNAQ